MEMDAEAHVGGARQKNGLRLDLPHYVRASVYRSLNLAKLFFTQIFN